MHELRIARNIIDSVLSEMEKRGLKKLSGVGLRIGALTDIVPESLEFGFNLLVADTPMTGAKLRIERVPVKGRCRECGTEFKVEDMQFLCPSCKARGIDLLQGQELEICYLDVDEANVDEGKAAQSWPG